MKEKKVFYGWWIVIGCLLLTAVTVPPVSVLNGVFTLPVTEELGITRSSFAIRGLIVSIIGIVLSPFVGKILMKYNMRIIHTLSLLGYCLSLAAHYFVKSLVSFYIIGVFLGFFFIFSTIIPASVVINNWFIAKRGLAMSIAMIGIGIGGFILSPILNALLKHYNWHTAYVVLAIIILVVSAPVSFFVLKKSPSEKGLQPLGYEEAQAVQQAKEIDHPLEASIQEKHVKIPFSESSKKPFFFMLLIGMLLAGLVNIGSLNQMSPAVEELHNADVRATMIMIFSLVGIFGKLIYGWVNDRFGIIASSLYGTGMFFLAFCCFLFSHNVLFVYVASVLYGLGNATGSVSPPLITSAIFKMKDYPAAYGMANSASGIGQALGNVIMSLIFDFTHSYIPIWISLLIMTAFMFFFWSGAYRASRKYC